MKRSGNQMKMRFLVPVVAALSTIGLFSSQVVLAAGMGHGRGASAGEPGMNPDRANVWISKVVVTPGSESGRYDITVTAREHNFAVKDGQGGTSAQGEGHIHFYLDLEPPTVQGKPAVPDEGDTWAHVSSNTYTFTNVAPGKHRVYVELVNNDHTPLSPAVVAERRVSVRAF